MLKVVESRDSGNLSILYRLTDSLYRAQSLDDILTASLDALVDALGSRASILLFDDAGVMQFVADRGLSEAYKARVRGHSPWKAGATEAEPIFVSDIEETAEPDWIKQTIRSENIRSLAFIPLFANGRVIGKFMTYHADWHDFTEEERQLAVVIARQLAFSIERYHAEDARRRAVEDLSESEERFRLMSEQAPVMIWMSNEAGHCLHLNKMLREFWGVPIDGITTFDWQTTMHPEDAPEIGRKIMGAMVARQPAAIDGRYLRHDDGTYRWLHTEARPRFSAGQFIGMIGVNVDVTEAREAERVLRESEQQLRIALRAGRMGMWRSDIATGAQSWDARQYDLFGVDPSTPVTREFFLSRVYPADLPKVARKEGRTPAEDGVLDTSFRIVLPDGGIRWLAGHSVAGPDILGGRERIGVNFDITEQKETEQRLLLLVDELNHRVKNTLAIVQSLAYQTFKGTSAEDARRAFEGRLITLANSHAYLTNDDWDGVSLESLLAQAFSSQGVNDRRFSMAGPSVHLKTKQAFALALAFHELCTNAIKHGALSNDDGRIDVRWQLSDGLRLTWTEKGGPAVSTPTRRGFGSKLVEQSLAKDLRGNVSTEFAPEGMRCLIEIPLSTKRP